VLDGRLPAEQGLSVILDVLLAVEVGGGAAAVLGAFAARDR